ncbi:hypothetical protein DVH26_02960 [Paenibacillus sp. H1-7]|uniref:hypothetical protein n=1 Tax=Paenibacillus sp. H1-7 TaxID=2282849 RepID=UPI001EF9A718|nr:hypothetical protein [Paenibacillus sp. H1-7]ULL13503.1 hypothetical protein DVH26_02960 [Paenibacillus sp. H1-7]
MDMRVLNEDELKSYISDENMQVFYIANYDDDRLNELRAYYTCLKRNVGSLSLEKSIIYYSAYFWYAQFKERYFELYGMDEGIAQEGFKLLEEIDIELEEGINWVLIEKIEQTI